MAYTERGHQLGYDNVAVASASAKEDISVGNVPAADASGDLNGVGGSKNFVENNAPGVAQPIEIP